MAFPLTGTVTSLGQISRPQSETISLHQSEERCSTKMAKFGADLSKLIFSIGFITTMAQLFFSSSDGWPVEGLSIEGAGIGLAAVSYVFLCRIDRQRVERAAGIRELGYRTVNTPECSPVNSDSESSDSTEATIGLLKEVPRTAPTSPRGYDAEAEEV